jgi:integrase
MATLKSITLASGETRWLARVHRRGAATLDRRFKTKTAAREWMNSIETRIDAGAQFAHKAVLDLTVADAVEAYLDHATIPSRQLSAFASVALDLGPIKIKDLSRAKIQGWLDRLAVTPVPALGPLGKGKTTPYAASTRRKFYFALKKSVEWHASELGYMLPPRLFNDLKVPGTWENQNDRRVSKDEEKALLAAAKAYGPQWPLLISLALETACRLQELVLNDWQYVSPTGDSLFVPKHICKTRTDRPIPLSMPARAIIKKLQGRGKRPSGRLFPGIPLPKDASDIFGQIAADAGHPDITFITLRHEATSRLCESGLFELYEMMMISGHTQMSTFSRYAKLLPSVLAKRFEPVKKPTKPPGKPAGK